MKDMKELKINFANKLKEYLDNKPHGTAAKLAKKLKLSESAISNYAAGRRSGSEIERRKIAKAIGLEYEEIIGIKKKETKNKVTEEMSHPELVELFQQQDLAWEINHDLIRLEKLDPSELEETHEYIKFRIEKKKRELSLNPDKSTYENLPDRLKETINPSPSGFFDSLIENHKSGKESS